MPDLQISKVLMISTAHHTADDSDLLDDHPNYATFMGVGHMVWIDRASFESFIVDLSALGFSSALIDVLRLAYSNDCNFVLFDNAGPIVEGLETFDW